MLQRLPYISLMAAFLVVVCGVVGQVAKIGPPLAIWVACFLIVFGFGKGCVGLGKLQLLKRVPHGGPDPRADFSSPTLFWFFIVFKFVTWAVAWAVAVYLFGNPTAFIEK